MKLEDFSFRLGNKELKPLIIGGMGVNISTREMALEAARLGGIGHISDAMLPSVCDKILGTNFTSKKAKAQRIYMNSIDKSQDVISSEMLREAALLYTRPIMEQKKGDGLVFVNCMEKLTMNDPLRTLKARLNALMDAGIDGITLGAGLHMASLSLMEDNPRFRDVKIAVSLYDDAFPGELDAGFRAKVEHEGVQDENLKILDNSSYQNLMRFVMDYADGIVLASEGVDAARTLREGGRGDVRGQGHGVLVGKPVLEYQAPEAEGFDNYNKFYEEL